ncbi:hypothetical protein [Staphylospora marina]|uniref:hypothetical protein n=1 Tax=Staphylospora marina TaxID=2490858 RepID=UPI000F5BAC0F|nr:hypothetical protein [Staphylospora marina]
MSAFRRFFSGVTETTDHAPEPDLKTRYYRVQQRAVMEKISEIIDRLSGFRLVHLDRERGEATLECRNRLGLIHDVVITATRVSPVQTAVDIHAALRFGVDPGLNRSIIRRIWAQLDGCFGENGSASRA